jgi:hypothetical protein
MLEMNDRPNDGPETAGIGFTLSMVQELEQQSPVFSRLELPSPIQRDVEERLGTKGFDLCQYAIPGSRSHCRNVNWNFSKAQPGSLSKAQGHSGRVFYRRRLRMTTWKVSASAS